VSRPLLRIVNKTGPGRRFPRVVPTGLLAVMVLFSSAPSDAQPAVRQVLMLQSFDRGTLPVDHFTSDFRVELDKRATEHVNVVQVVVGPRGSVAASDQAIVDYIRSLFVDHPKPDLIVTAAGPAAVFARKYRQQLFPDVPLLLASVNQQYLRDAPLGENETAVAVVSDFPGVIDLILELLPQTKQVFVVVGSGQSGTFWSRELQTRFMRFQDRLTFIWSGGLSLPEILRQCASLPRDSAILYLSLGTDGRGGAYADARVLADLHAAANAPMFSAFTPLFGHGVVGGSMMSIGGLARSTADVAGRLLNGAPPASLRIAPQGRGEPMFDWRELQRWGIQESRLPPGSIVQFRRPSLWDEYKWTVLAAITVLLLQTLLIARLLYERRARRRARSTAARTFLSPPTPIGAEPCRRWLLRSDTSSGNLSVRSGTTPRRFR